MAKLDVRVYPLKDDPENPNSTKAFASITVDELIAIKGIRVVEGTKGHFVTMPQSKDTEGNYHDIAFPVNGDLRKAMNKAILDEFKEVTKSAEKTADKTTNKSASAPAANKDTNDEPDL
jgi:stage V sporulation protein G